MIEVDEVELQRAAAVVTQFERAVGNDAAVWEALESLRRATPGDPWQWLGAVARARRHRGEALATARIFAVADYCWNDTVPKFTPTDWERIGVRPPHDQDMAVIVPEAFISLSGMDGDTVVVKNLGGQLDAGLLLAGSAMELRRLDTAGIAIMPELVELAGQLVRKLGLEEVEGMRSSP